MPQSSMPAPALSSRIRALADPRAARGRRHTLSCVILTALCAILAGARSFAAIGQWAANAPQHTLARLGARTTHPALAVRQPPSADTIRRVLIALPPAHLTALNCDDDLSVLIVDGKCARGSARGQSGPAHLLAAMTGHGQVAAQLRVPDKTSEIHALADLLAGLDITGAVVSADALHTQKATAAHLVQERGAHYLLGCKANQPTLFSQVKKLPWGKAPVLARTRESGHGRRETRSIKVLSACGLLFPHAAQAVQVLRTTTRIADGVQTRRTGYYITDMTCEKASPQRLMGLVRRHWGIEALHHIRDATFGEDASKVRCGRGLENMAMLRNLAIPLLASLENTATIAESIRWVSYEAFTRPLDLIGLP
ncbi:putative transposase YbfD/YdcC [Nocardiopsis mwathae]|uniref:Putative transposase YbfD/YdcC n=1 Tax=Nocardiopsis mwathae TaxID=1472723 RepID=A0A7X0D7A8_9ACTN|nr:putative transposase YbfD/YdcC [Nocardiopsis mwathae]